MGGESDRLEARAESADGKRFAQDDTNVVAACAVPYVGLRLALHHPKLLRSLLLLNTSADAEPEAHLGRYRMLKFVARWFGLKVIAGRVMPIMFGGKFLKDPDRADLRAQCRQELIANHRIGITRALEGVLSRKSVEGLLDQIRTPSLIIIGGQDAAVAPEESERMHRHIRESKRVVVPDSGHSLTIEEPAAVNEALAEFLGSLSQG